MALISCPECGKQISDTTPSCPHCGYKLSSLTEPKTPSPTKIGEISQNYGAGFAMILFGLLFVLVSFFAFVMFLPLGILVCWVPIFLLGTGIQKIAGTRSICCPHCGRIAEVGKNFDTYKCPVCKKRSVRENDYLKPIL